MNVLDLDCEAILSSDEPEVLNRLKAAAEKVRLANLGDRVYMRGLIEYSNQCRRDCLYCGLRKSKRSIRRYHLQSAQIREICRNARQMGMTSIALQSGETGSDKEVDFIAAVIRQIKEESSRDGSPGLGVTLSIGELSYNQYRRLFDAGAHRYLLRIESSDREIFNRIHPREQIFERRLECLSALKDIGFQVGTGIMIALPGQSYASLARDLQFFLDRDIDMLGMGPYIPQVQTPLAYARDYAIRDPFAATVKMMALARLMMPDINMVVSTALQTIRPDGLKEGIKAGGNVVMPVLTPAENRGDYALYQHKQYKSLEQMQMEVEAAGYRLSYGQWGDAPHYFKRRQIPYAHVPTVNVVS